MDTVTARLTNIENELKAQKSSSSLNYGALYKTEDTPTATWSGNVSNTVVSGTDINARFILTFTRTDGVDKPPLVNFPYDYTLARYRYDDARASGSMTNVTGPDVHAWDEVFFSDALYEVGSNYVKWKIEIGNNWYYEASNGTTVTITAQAISSVDGNLTIVRAL